MVAGRQGVKLQAAGLDKQGQSLQNWGNWGDYGPQAVRFPRAMLLLVVVLLVLPIAISVLVAVSALLVTMGDTIGGVVLKYIALGCGIVWVVGLVCMVVLQGFRSLDDPPSQDDRCGPNDHE